MHFTPNGFRWLTRVSGALVAVMLATGCASFAKRSYFDTTGNHESPHPHRPDVGVSTAEPAEEPVRVRDPGERARMERYIAGHVDRDAVVATIQLSAQELVDCVAIDRQPALRRPALRGHTVRPQPPAEAKEDAREGATPLSGDPARPDQLGIPKAEYGADGKTCPERSIPVRRLTIEILDNFATLDDFFRARPPHELAGPTNLHQYANSYVFVDNWGAQSTLNVWSPYTEWASEFSLSQIAVVRGSGADKETLETGWQKFRDLYGDFRPRLFIYFTPDNYGSGGCYNLTCGAFVQVNNSVYIGGGFTNISAHPHPSTVWEFTVRWQRHGDTGDWWLKYGDTWVGYYPSELFDDNGLRPRGSKASFYGEIIDEQPGGRHTRTDMGSGHFPGDGFGYAAYQRRVRTITTGNVWNIRPALTADRTDANCYDIEVHDSSGIWERYFYFGGPGYNTHCR
jgi:hypothetical protein